MSKLRIEVDDDGLWHTFVDDQPTGIQASLRFEIRNNGPQLDVVVYDHKGYSKDCVELFSRLPYAQVFVAKVGEGKRP